MDNGRVQAFYRQAVNRLTRGREAVLRAAYENSLFWADIQWIRWSGVEHTFVSANTTRNKPRPVENVFRPKLMKAISRLSAVEPSLTFAPGNEKEDARITADNGRLVLRYIQDVVRYEELRLRLAYQTVLFGNAWLINSYDPEGGPLIDVGNGRMEPQGEQCAEVGNVYEMLLDYTIPDQRRQPVVIHRKMRTLEWLREHYPNSDAKDKDGDNSNAAGDLGLTMLQNIVRLQPTLVSIVGSGAQYSNAVIVDDVFALPCKDFPQGLLARVVNDGEEVLESKPLPFHDGTPVQRGKVFIPVTHFGYDEVPGALLCTTPANSLKEPQRQRNRLISHILLYFARSANGVWAIPENADVSTIGGTEGIVIRFTANSTGGGAPQRIEGGTLPSTFAERLNQIEKTMDDIVTIGDMAENFPRMDSPNMLNTILEQQQQQLGPVFKRWGNAWVEAAKQQFFIFRNFAPEELFYKIKGEQARWSWKKIETADLYGGVDIKVEANSLQPQTILQKKSSYEQFASVVATAPQSPFMADPDVQLKFARAYGCVELLEGLEADENQIAREHDALIAWAKQYFDMATGQLLPGVDPNDPGLTMPVHVDPDFDNQVLHLQRHREFCQSEEFQGLPLSVQEAFRVYHYRVHMQLYAEQQMGAAPGAGGGAAQGPQQAPPQGGSAGPNGG